MNIAPGKIFAAAVDHFAQIVGCGLLGLAADAQHAVALVEQQDQAGVSPALAPPDTSERSILKALFLLIFSVTPIAAQIAHIVRA